MTGGLTDDSWLGRLVFSSSWRLWRRRRAVVSAALPDLVRRRNTEGKSATEPARGAELVGEEWRASLLPRVRLARGGVELRTKDKGLELTALPSSAPRLHLDVTEAAGRPLDGRSEATSTPPSLRSLPLCSTDAKSRFRAEEGSPADSATRSLPRPTLQVEEDPAEVTPPLLPPSPSRASPPRMRLRTRTRTG